MEQKVSKEELERIRNQVNKTEDNIQDIVEYEPEDGIFARKSSLKNKDKE